MFLVYVVLFLVVNTSAINCLERLVSEMTCIEWDVKPSHSLLGVLQHLGLQFLGPAIGGSKKFLTVEAD